MSRQGATWLLSQHLRGWLMLGNHQSHPGLHSKTLLQKEKRRKRNRREIRTGKGGAGRRGRKEKRKEECIWKQTEEEKDME